MAHANTEQRPRRAAFREHPSASEALAIDRRLVERPGAFGLFFDCPEPLKFNPDAVDPDGVAVLRISGPLENSASWLWHSYEGIVAAASAAVACPAVRALALRIESPGGVAAGMADVHRELARLASGDKPVFAWCQQGCSAAYNLASACSEVWVPDDGEVGSVGVILCTIDETARLADEGVAVRYVVTGERKADLHPGTAITPEVLNVAQAKVDQLGALFFRAVGRARGLKPAYVQGLEAATFLGADAVEVGLADGVAPWTDFLAFVRGLFSATPGTPGTPMRLPVAQPSAP